MLAKLKQKLISKPVVNLNEIRMVEACIMCKNLKKKTETDWFLYVKANKPYELIIHQYSGELLTTLGIDDVLLYDTISGEAPIFQNDILKIINDELKKND